MCRNLTILAKESATRYIARCEHGTVHLVWDNLSIRLRPADFVRLTENACTRAGNLMDRDDEKKGFRLRMHGIGIEFPPETLATLRDLMCVAVLQMEKPTGACNESKTLEVALDGFPWAPPPFSLN
jgi:hypothetical protein